MGNVNFKPPAINTVDDAQETTVLLGFSRYLCRDFERNNIQMTGNWYLEAIDENVNALHRAILEHGYRTVNFVGISKSCTGGFIFAGRLSRLLPDVQFRVFGFSSYTTMNRSWYEENGKVEYVPESLEEIWASEASRALANVVGDADSYLGVENLHYFLIYPNRSRGGEPELAKRLEGMPNCHMIPLEVRVHGVLFPFWRKLLPDQKIELFEGQVKKLPAHAYDYFSRMQAWDPFNFNLYSVVYDTDSFMKNMITFNETIQPLSQETE